MANEIPHLSGLTGALTFDEDTVIASPQRLDVDVSFSDVDFYDGVLRIAGLLAEDRLGIATDSVISISGNNVLYNGSIIGQFSGGQGNAFAVFFNTSATAPAVEALVEHLTYQNVSESPTATRTLSLSIQDAHGDWAKPGFSATPDAANPFNGIDVGTYSKPTAADLNGDGRLDLVVGAFDGTLRTYYRNGDGSYSEQTGTANPFNGIDVGFDIAPTLADLNSDGRLDLVVGASDGTLRTYYRNTDSSYSEQTGAANPFNGIDVGDCSAPALADLNGDGRLDLIVGTQYGTLKTYYRNGDGSYSQQFNAANPFNGINVGTYSSPALADLNGDGRLDLIVGAYDGTLRTYHRSTNGSYIAQIGSANPFNGIDVGSYSMPTLADLDGDGFLDAVIGKFEGTLQTYTGGTGLDIIVNVRPQNEVPVLDGVSGTLSLRQVVAGTAAQRLYESASFTDSDFNAGTLEVRGAVAGDRVGLATDSVIGLIGSTVTINGTAIGIVSGGDGSTFTVAFNASANAAAVTAVLQHLTYQVVTDAPAASRSLQVVVTDGNGLQATRPALDVDYDAAPRVLSIVYGDNDGTVRAGESVTFTVTFSEAVTVVGGIPVLVLTDGGAATYLSGSGTESLVFAHTVGRGQNAPDLAVTGIDVKGGTIRDARGQDVITLGAGGINPDGVLVVDTLAPSVPVFDGPTAGGANVYTGMPTLTGIAEAGSHVTLYIDGDFHGTVTTGSDGRFSYTPTDSLALGHHTVGAIAQDAAGNTRLQTGGFTIKGDTITGTTGADTLTSVVGDDLMIGLAGNDTYRVNSAGDIVQEAGGGGSDTVLASVSYTLGAGQEIETVRAAGKAGVGLTGNEFANKIIGGTGNDVLDGGAGADALYGKGGDDTYVVDNAKDRVFEDNNSGNDTVRSSVSYVLAAGQSIETLRTTNDSGTAAINLTGNAFTNAVIGNDGANVITGGTGGDILTGRAGADTFVFKTLADSTVMASGRDTIQDFSGANGDRIDLHLIDAVAGGSVNQAFKFIGADDFHHRAGELQADLQDGNTLVSGDVNGDGAADFSILLKGVMTLHSGDFIL